MIEKYFVSLRPVKKSVPFANSFDEAFNQYDKPKDSFAFAHPLNND